ncbi:hypothetical protein H2203_008186 [Taxawa tesnikishii (nom. ined.)]|nr:hypothetical protein H2203_008186 [Dothideales sp. JES 119]
MTFIAKLFKPTTLDLATRRKICEDTIFRSPTIATETPHGSLDSSFVPSQLLALSRSSPTYPNLQLQPVKIIDSDAFAAARALLETDPARSGRIAVLNLASDEEPGGGWRYTLSVTQEEALCYSSTLYATLRPEFYPWPNLGPGSAAGIFSPGVVVFRDTTDNGLAELPVQKRFLVSVITIAAPRLPELTEDGAEFARESDLRDLREKIRLVYRMAAHNGQTNLVLGAMGCGAYRCPPALMAKEMKGILGGEEFDGWFENVVFAIYAHGKAGERNLEAFRREFGTGWRGV